MSTSRDETIALDIAAAVQTRDKIAMLASDDADIIDVTDALDSPLTGSIAAQVKGNAYSQTAVLYSAQATGDYTGTTKDKYPDAAWLGRVLPLTPGSETWAFKTLAGIVADALTTTQRNNATDKHANIYVTAGGVSQTRFGTTGEPEFLDVIRFVHSLKSDMTARIHTRLVNLDKIPFTRKSVV